MGGSDVMLIPFLNRFLHWSVVGVISPVLVLMIQSKGVALPDVGVVMAALSACVVFFELPSGVLSDLVGRRRVYLASIAVAIAGYAVMMAAADFRLVCAAVAVYGISRAFSSGSIEALYIDSFLEKRGKDRLHSLVAAMNVGEALGLTLGALAGGMLPSLWRRLYPASNPYNGNLAAQIALLLLLFGLTLATPYRDGPRTRTGLRRLLSESVAAVRGNGVVARLLAGVFFWGAAFSAVETYWQPHLRGLLGDDGSIWLFGVVNGAYFAAAIAGNAAISVILPKLRSAPAIAVAGVLRLATGAAVIVMAAQGSAAGFAFAFVAVMCANGMMSVPEGTAFNGEIPPSTRASLLSLSSLMMQAGGIAASLGFSALIRHSSIRTVWLVAGCLLAGSAWLYLGRRSGKRSGRSVGGGASSFSVPGAASAPAAVESAPCAAAGGRP